MLETNGMLFVKRMDEARKNRNLSRSQIATDCGVALNTITTWSTRGSLPACDTAIRIARYLGVSVEWLVYGIDPEGLTTEERALVRTIRACDTRDRETIQLLAESLSHRYLDTGDKTAGGTSAG